ncbi:MAG: sodium/proline symporter [Ruminococcaceae bacterium]|nr:sodium/proline symporter [Oscillospiraceae bacterium]
MAPSLKYTMLGLSILAYMAYIVWIGIKFSRKNKSTDDFYLGGRKLGPYVTAMSAEASDMSSWLLMGLPGLALATSFVGATTGFAEAVWTAIGLAIGTYLNWLIVAKRIRHYSARTKSNTIPDFFSDRFGDKAGFLTAIAAVVIVVFFVPYTASGFSAVGKLFESILGVPYHAAMIVGAIILVAYTILGGFLAASTTDLIQSIVMTFALFVIICFGVESAGGLQNVSGNISSMAGFGGFQKYFSLTGTDGSFGFLPIVSTLAWGLGYFGMPHILLRFMAIEDSNKLKVARRVATVWVVISMAIAILIGVIGFSFASTSGLLTTEGFDPERIIVYMADAIGSLDTFAAIIAGLIIAGILASIMSTADSQLLAASSSVSENIVKRFAWKNMSNKAQMWVARGTVVVIAIIAVFFAWNPDSSVFRIVSFAWAGFGATFGPLVLCALFWKRTNKWGALAGMLSGGTVVFIWKYVIRPLGGFWDIYELLPAFLVSLLFIIAISLATPAPEKEITDTFDAVKAELKGYTDLSNEVADNAGEESETVNKEA